MPKVLREVAAYCPDAPIGPTERDRILDGLCRLGPWLRDVVAAPLIHRAEGIPTLQLAFVKAAEPRLEIVLGHRFEALDATWTPASGRDTVWRWQDDAAHFHVREVVAEAARLTDVASALGLELRPPSWRRVLVGNEAILEFLNRDFGDLRVEWAVDSDRPASFGARGLNINVRSIASLLEVSGSYEHLGRSLPLEELLAEIRHGRRFGWSKTAGTWFEVAPGIAEALRTFALGMGQSRGGQTTLTAWAIPAVSELGARDAQVTLPEALPQFVPTERRLAEALAMTVELPAGLRDVTLRGYQRQGFEWLMQTAHWSPGALMADDMGLGKSLQALCGAALRAPRGPTLVIASKTLAGNWRNEADRFLPRVFRVRPVLDSTAEERLVTHGAHAGDLVITTWNRVQQAPDRFLGPRWVTVVLDEVHTVKNAATVTYKAVEKVTRAATASGAFVLGLSGTPVQNHVGELEAIFELLVPGYLKGVGALRRPGDDGVSDARAALRAAIRPFFLRRRKEDVARELPPRIETRVPVELSVPERERYEEIRRAAIESLRQNGGGGGNGHVFGWLMSLRQICLDWRILRDGHDHRTTGSKTVAIVERVLDLVAEERPCLIFSQFTSYLDLLETALCGRGLSLLRIDGKTPRGERDKAVASFQEGRSSVFLLGLKSGGEGLNLTRATEVLLVDPWWTRAAERQAMDRAHRLGQTRTVNVWRFIAEDTIEEHIVNLANEKQALVDDLIEGRERAETLSLEDLRRMLAFGTIGGEG